MSLSFRASPSSGQVSSRPTHPFCCLGTEVVDTVSVYTLTGLAPRWRTPHAVGLARVRDPAGPDVTRLIDLSWTCRRLSAGQVLFPRRRRRAESTMPGAGRRGAALLAVLIPMLWLALPAPVASAHAYLLGSTPPSGYAVPSPPTAVSLDFDQPVTVGAAPLSLADTTGRPYALGPAALSLGGRRLAAPVLARLVEGGYRIHWEVTADDGDVVSGNVSFAVGTAAPVPGSADVDGGALDPPIVIVARWVLFAGVALALGGVVGDLLARRVQREVSVREPDRPRPLLGRVCGILMFGCGRSCSCMLVMI